MARQTLSEYLERYTETGPLALSVASVIDAIAAACVEIAGLTAGATPAELGEIVLQKNADGDLQKDLDVRADAIIRQSLSRVPIAAFASEECAECELHNSDAKLCVAIDPLDGSSNIEINMSVGTIFSITPMPQDASSVFHEKGAAQIAAGFVVYGPQTSLVLTLGDGVDVFTLDQTDGVFRLTRCKVQIPAAAPEFAINASNQRHWDPHVLAFIEDCLAGLDGPLGRDFNMRWIGSLVAEAYRILTRGGIFLYPGDARKGYADGRLRLVYEAHPIAFIIEQAGGATSTGRQRILDLASETLHQRVPLIMGSADLVSRAERLYASPDIMHRSDAPLFAHRGFFRV